MKKAIKTFALMLLAAVIGGALGVGAMVLDWSDNAVISVMFCGCVVAALCIGLFDIVSRKSVEHQTIKDAARLGKVA